MAVTPQTIADSYPIPVYRFEVNYASESIPFSEVSGLDIGVETITYKHGRGKMHMPGQPTDVNITLKRGLVRKQSQFYDWLASIRLNLVEKIDIDISLVDDEGTHLVTWHVSNAFPKKLTAPSINGGSNEASVESLELMADDIKITFH